MTVDEFLRYFPDLAAKLTEEQLACCRYLQREGKHFCVDFGYENASSLVWAAMETEMETLEFPI